MNVWSIIMDFSENYLCKYSKKVRPVNFGASRQQITLYTRMFNLSRNIWHYVIRKSNRCNSKQSCRRRWDKTRQRYLRLCTLTVMSILQKKVKNIYISTVLDKNIQKIHTIIPAKYQLSLAQEKFINVTGKGKGLP